MTHLRQYFGKRGFAVIFTHYNGSRAFINTSVIKAYDHMPASPNLRGYVNSLGTKA